jgi:hypothetical protein
MIPSPPQPALSYGRYRLLSRLGAGRLTEAWKAKSFGVEGFEKLLVIKRLHPALAGDARFLAGFVREAKLAVRLSHTNVVQVFDLGRVEAADGTSYYMATEYVAGVDLSWLLQSIASSGEPLPVPACVYLGIEAAKGVDHAHRRRDERMQPLGAVHGNLTPRNLLISWDGEVKVSDFCVTRALDDTYEGPLLGASGAHPAAVLGDLRALGGLLERLLALGRAGAFPEALRRIVERAVTPELGFASAAELHEELMPYAYGAGGRCDGTELAELLARYRALVEPAAVEDELAAAGAGAFADVRLGDSLPPLAEERAATAFRAAPAGRVPAPLVTPPPAAVSGTEEPAPGSAGKWPKPGERRESSLLVLCGSGSDALSSDVRERAREIMRRYGGHLLGSAPTELVAVFGLSQSDGRDTENAVRCGLVLLRSLAHEPGQAALGVDSGSLALSAAGELEQGAANAQCLETARRLARAVPQRLAISERARANLRGLFALEPGAHADEAHFLVGEPRELEEVFGPFVGRKPELSRIGELLARASTGKLTTLGLVGAAGVGKTRLLVETRARLAQRAFNVGFYMATCPPRGEQNPYSGVAAMLRVLCGVHEGDAFEQIRLQQPRLRALGLTDDELGEVFAALQVSPSPVARRRDVLLSAIVRMFHSLAEDRLHLFAWDDAQALDAESAGLLVASGSKLLNTRAMLVFAGRSLAAPVGELPGYVRVEVPGLPEEDARKLVSRRLGVAEVPEALMQAVQGRAAGHPLFIEELLHQAFESGALAIDGGNLELVNLDRIIGVPRSLRTLLGERLQRLPEREHRLLVAVATLGGSADVALCAALLTLPLGEVNALAEELTRRELLVREGPVTVNFRSPLLAELLVSGLTTEMKQTLMRRALRAYQAIRGADAEVQALRVAEHLALPDAERALRPIAMRSSADET